MDENTQFWLNRVATKLYQSFMAGMDFEHDEHRWIFDWEGDISIEENLENVSSEEKALILLAQVGVIRSSAKANYFRDQQHEGWERFGKDSGGMWGERWEQTDPAHREYDFIRYIENLDWDKFLAFCSDHGLNYKDDKVAATLEIINQKPRIRAERKEYILKALQSGSPLEIIELSKAHTGEQVTFDKLRQWTGRPNAYMTYKNFNQIFRKNEFGEGNLLHPFVEMQSDTFMLKQQALLTPKELSAIRKASTV